MLNEKIRIRLKAYDHRVLDQSTTEMLDSAGVIQDPGEMFLSRDSADKPEYNRPRVSIV